MKTIGTHRKYEILLTDNSDHGFYCSMGKFFSSKEIIKELEGPIFDADNYRWLVVKLNAEIVAFSSCRDAGGGVWWFNQTWVHPSHRRKGIYRKLFKLKTAYCLEQGATVLKGMANLLSKPLFDVSGWTETSKRGPRWTWYEKKVNGAK
jgi:GNAT superfamily N-acetyltransferase